MVDTESQIVLATEVLYGNAGDATRAIDLVEQAEENIGEKVEEAIARLRRVARTHVRALRMRD